MKNVTLSTIAILSAAILAMGCEWSGGSPDAGKRDILEFKLPAKKVTIPKVVEKVTEAQPVIEDVEVGIDLSDSVPDIAFEHVDTQPTDHVIIAQELTAAGDRAAAMIELGKALYDDPEDFDAAFMLGRTAQRSGKVDMAAEAFLLAAQIDPEVASPWLQLTRLALAAKDNDLAAKRIRHALTIDPKLAQAHNLLGRVWLNRSHWHKAVNCFEKAVTLSPDNRYYWNNLGYAYLLKKDFSQAVIALEAAVEEGDGEVAAAIPAYIRNNLGLAYEGAGRLQDAIVEFKQALETKPGYINAKINLERNVRLAKAEAEVDEITTDELLIETEPDDDDLIIVVPDE
jgi:tetratricopeptide (TPR) repeat protein